MRTSAINIFFFKPELAGVLMTPETMRIQALQFVYDNMKPIKSLGYYEQSAQQRKILEQQGIELEKTYDYYAWTDGHIYHILNGKVYRSTNNTTVKGIPIYLAGGTMHTIPRLVYEAYYGEIAPTDVVIFKDKNKSNCSPENLALAAKGSVIEKEKYSYLKGMQDLMQASKDYPTCDLDELYRGFEQLNADTSGVKVYYNGKEIK